jgi:hypothetical protein
MVTWQQKNPAICARCSVRLSSYDPHLPPVCEGCYSGHVVTAEWDILTVLDMLDQIDSRADESGTPGRAEAIRQAAQDARELMASGQLQEAAAELMDRDCNGNANLQADDLARLIRAVARMLDAAGKNGATKIAAEGTWEFDSVENIWSYGQPGSEATATVEKLEDDELVALVPGGDYVWTIDGPAEGDEDGDWGTVDEGEAGTLEQAKADAAAAFDGLYSRGKV